MGAPLQIQSAQLILVGNFNPYLISPQWLADQNVWSSDTTRLALGAIKDGVQFQDESTQWSVASDHLIISSIDQNCGVLADRVLKELPHTPISSVKTDFFFHSDTLEDFDSIFSGIEAGPLGKLSTGLLTTSSIFHNDDCRIEARLAKGADGVTASIH